MINQVVAKLSAVVILALVLREVGADDSQVLHRIFGSEFLQENSLHVHDAASLMPAEKRFEFLADRVLPSDQHPTFQVTAEFGSTNPPPFAEQPSEADARLTPGVVVISPAVDLVAVARLLDRLDELRKRVAAASVPLEDAQQNYAKATLRFLVEVASEDFDSAVLAFDDVIAHSKNLDSKTAEARWPAVLMLRAAMAHPDEEIRRHVTEFFFSSYQDLRNYSSNARLDVINDHLRKIFGLNSFLGNEEIRDTLPIKLDDQWVPFSYSDSQTRGLGRPTGRWHSIDGRVLKVPGHEMDYLSFRSPLVGNYQVECDFSSDGGNYFSFMIGGSIVQAVSNGAALRIANFRKPYTDTPLELPLTQFRSSVRFRATVQDGVLSHFVNGQKVHTKKLPEQHDPWIAMRAWRRSMGSVRDFRITGEPVVPDEISLTGDPDLPGWAPYFETGFGKDRGNWQTLDGGERGTVILGVYRPEYSGSNVQKLLRYCRPVIEDGTIEYEFYYREGDTCVYPALDRLAFLLDPDGVKIHWITDRRYERFLNDPANVSEEPENRIGPERLPLMNGAWNRLRIDVTGDTIQLTLNDQAIYQRKLESSNQRTFGLFHYADRTKALVRNVRWRGDWPKQIPSLTDQVLADAQIDQFDENRKKLADHFHHDFRKDPLHEHFDLAGKSTNITPTEFGLRQEMVGHDGTKQLKSGLRISGDFDITATFQDLEHFMAEPCWELRTGFILYFNSETKDACGFYRKLARNKTNRRVALGHSWQPPDRPFSTRSGYAVEESKSGRLRMVRQGSTLYGLYAEEDSPNFRLIKKFDVTDGPLAVQGLRLTFMSSKNATVAATWNSLDVWAEEISGLPISDPKPIVTALNEQRESMLPRTINFADLDSLVNNFSITASNLPEIKAEPTGIRATTVSAGRSESTVLVSKVPLGRGTDVEWKFDVKELGHPDSLSTKSEIALKVFFEYSELSNASPHEATFILRQTRDGERDLVTRIVFRNAANRTQYRPLLTTPVKSPDAFRTVVRDGLLYFLYSEAGSDEYHIASTAPVIDDLRSRGVELKFVAAGGDEHKSDLVMKKLIVHEPDDSRAALSD